MANKYAEREGMHINCPFCGYLCDGFVKLSFCSRCYAEYEPKPTKAKPFRFVFTDVPSGRLAWSKAFHKAGGVRVGGTKPTSDK